MPQLSETSNVPLELLTTLAMLFSMASSQQAFLLMYHPRGQRWILSNEEYSGLFAPVVDTEYFY